MNHFWRKPGKTLIYLLSLFMTIGLLCVPVYAEHGDETNPTGTGTQTETNTDGNNGDGTSGQTGGTDTQQLAAPADTRAASTPETRKGSITTLLQDNASENLKTYLAGNESKLTIEFYKIAPAMKDAVYASYTYPFADKFTVAGYDLGAYSGTAANTKYLKDIVTADWETLAQTLAAKVKDTADITADASAVYGQSKELDAGLYLVLARGTELTAKTDYFEELETETGSETGGTSSTLCTIMKTDEYIYYFTPVLLAIPSTNVETNTPEMQSSDGEWKFDNLKVYLKPTEKPFKGKLKITKEVEVLEDRLDNTTTHVITPMTAAFRITGWKSEQDMKDNKPSVYSNVASIRIPNGTPVILDNIPVGTYVKVEEMYTGAGYKLTSPGVVYKEITKPQQPDDSDIVTFSFVDTYDDKITKGYGIMNTFTADKNGKLQWKNDLTGTTVSASDRPQGGN